MVLQNYKYCFHQAYYIVQWPQEDERNKALRRHHHQSSHLQVNLCRMQGVSKATYTYLDLIYAHEHSYHH